MRELLRLLFRFHGRLPREIDNRELKRILGEPLFTHPPRKRRRMVQ